MEAYVKELFEGDMANLGQPPDAGLKSCFLEIMNVVFYTAYKCVKIVSLIDRCTLPKNEY